MKPVAPALRADDAQSELPSLQSEIRRMCDAKATEARATIPAPPSLEALRAATPYPPPARGEAEQPSELDEERQRQRQREAELDTIPAPPPASSTRKLEGGEDESGEPDGERAPSTIPGPPRMPRIAG
jgi:hypothetical protein